MSNLKHVCTPELQRRFRMFLPLLFGALFLSLSTWNASAHDLPPDLIAEGSLVDVQVKVDGRMTPLFLAPGRDDRHYFQAFRGRNYSLMIHNRTGGRVGVLIAVDGLNVVNGERSRLSNGEAMYVLDPWEQTEIRGWRTSLSDVRRFVFVDEEDSYAERSDKANADMGWVRVLSFREQGRRWLDEGGGPMRNNRPGERKELGERDTRERPDNPGDRSIAGNETAPKAEGLYDSQAESNPGTGWGQKSHDPVRRTTFNAEPRAFDHLVMRYEYASGLLALGIDLHPRRNRLRERENGDFGFAQPPWRK